MKGQRIAVYGLGRSGLAIARAALRFGARPSVYDRAFAEEMVKQDILEAARDLGIEIHLGWEGRFDPAETNILVPNPSVDMRSHVLQSAVADGIEILSEIEFAWRISHAPIVAITGTNGKSTTTVMTYLALRECGIDAVLCGNVFGTGLPEMPLTEAALHATREQVLVAEVSSFQLEWVSRFRPAVAGITNIAPDHLDRYRSFEEYAATKLRIFAAQRAEDFAVIRAFDPQVRLIGSAGPATSPSIHRRSPPTVSAHQNRGVRSEATILTFGAQGEHAQVKEEEIRILDARIGVDEVNVIGTHNHANLAMAGLLSFAALSWLSARPEFGGTSGTATDLLRGGGRGFSLPEPAVRALKAFKGIEHRMEYLGSKNGVRVINNSMCTNPDAVVKSAQAVKGPSHLIMGGKDKDLPFLPVKNYLASGMHKAYLFGEAKDLLNRQLGGGFPTYNTLQEAFRAATEQARPGEVIMLAPGCASTDQFHDFRDRGNVFKTIAKEWLES